MRCHIWCLLGILGKYVAYRFITLDTSNAHSAVIFQKIIEFESYGKVSKSNGCLGMGWIIAFNVTLKRSI